MKIFTQLEVVPADYCRAVRNPRGGILRAVETLLRSRWVSGFDGTHVRGARIAVDYLTEALSHHCHASQFTIFLPSRELARLNAAGRTGNTPCHVRYASEVKLLHGVVDFMADGVWFDPTGVPTRAMKLRELRSTQVFPIASFQHGLSRHDNLFDIFLRILLSRTYPCDSLVCGSRASKTAVENLLHRMIEQFDRQFGTKLPFPGRVDVIPLCIDTAAFRPRDRIELRARVGLRKSDIVLVFCGYLSALKADLCPLLEVFRQLLLSRKKRDLCLLIVGGGKASYLDVLQERIRALGLRTRVRVERDVSDERKRDLLGASDIFVSPADNLQESFGLTPIEAMACGLPQVVSDWDGYRETVRHGVTGYRIPTYWARCDEEYWGTGNVLGWRYDHIVAGQSVAVDCRAMYQALQSLIENSERRAAMSIASRACAIQEYSYDAVARQYDSLWAELRTIADGLERAAGVRSVDCPAYFDVFGHYATANLQDNQPFLIDQAPQEPLANLTGSAHTEVAGVRILDERLLTALIDVAKSRACASSDPRRAEITMLQLIESAMDHGYGPSTIRRHILWLVKYGVLHPVDQVHSLTVDDTGQ